MLLSTCGFLKLSKDFLLGFKEEVGSCVAACEGMETKQLFTDCVTEMITDGLNVDETIVVDLQVPSVGNFLCVVGPYHYD